jgi:hypothetical protein
LIKELKQIQLVMVLEEEASLQSLLKSHDQDNRFAVTSPNTMKPSILQGKLLGSAAVGDKRPNLESSGSQMTRRRITAFITSRCTISRPHLVISPESK